MITPYVPLVLRENLEKVGNSGYKKNVGNKFVSARRVSAKCADFWLSGRHVADMSATFPAKSSVVRCCHPYQLSSHVSTLVHRYDYYAFISTFYCTYISFYLSSFYSTLLSKYSTSTFY